MSREAGDQEPPVVELYDSVPVPDWDINGTMFFRPTQPTPIVAVEGPEYEVRQLLVTADGGGWGNTRWSLNDSPWASVQPYRPPWVAVRSEDDVVLFRQTWEILVPVPFVVNMLRSFLLCGRGTPGDGPVVRAVVRLSLARSAP